jgi:hypothetical protein
VAQLGKAVPQLVQQRHGAMRVLDVGRVHLRRAQSLACR